MAPERNSRLMEMLGDKEGRINTKERKVLDYLLKHEDHIQDLSIIDIADEAGVSKATVVRFCKVLDFNGLKDFKVWYEAGKGIRFAPVEVVSGKEDTSVVFSKLRNGAVGTMERTLDIRNAGVIDSMVVNIRKYSSVLIAGGDEEKVYADALARVISSRFPDKKVAVNPDKSERFEYCIVLSLTGTDRDAMTSLTNVVLEGGRAGVITSDSSSLVGKAGDECLVVSDDLILESDRHLLGRLSLSAVVNAFEIVLSRE